MSQNQESDHSPEDIQVLQMQVVGFLRLELEVLSGNDNAGVHIQKIWLQLVNNQQVWCCRHHFEVSMSQLAVHNSESITIAVRVRFKNQLDLQQVQDTPTLAQLQM